MGAGLPEVVQVTALACGTAVVHMTQRRPWERDGPPRAQHHTHVVVVERPAPSSTEEPTAGGTVPGHPAEPPTGVDAGAGPEDTASWVAPPVDP